MRMSSWMMCWRKNLTDKILTVATRNFDHGFEKILTAYPLRGRRSFIIFGQDQQRLERVKCGNASITPPEAAERKKKQRGYTDIPQTLKALRTQEKPRQRGRGLLCLIVAAALAFPMSAGRFPDAEERKQHCFTSLKARFIK